MTVNQVTEAIVDFKYVNGTSSKVKIKGPFRTEVVSPNVDIYRASYEELASRAEQYASEIAEQATKLKKYRVNPTRFWTDSIKSALEREGQKFSELATKLNNVKEAIDSDSDSDAGGAAASSPTPPPSSAAVVGGAPGSPTGSEVVAAHRPAAHRAQAGHTVQVEHMEPVAEVVAAPSSAAASVAETGSPTGSEAAEARKEAIAAVAKAAGEAEVQAKEVQKLLKPGDVIYNKVNERIDFATKVKSRMEQEMTSSTRTTGGEDSLTAGGTSGGGALTSRGYVAKKIKPYSSNNITNKLNIIKPKAKKSRVAKLKLDKLNRKVQEYSKKIRNLKKISRRVTYKKQ